MMAECPCRCGHEFEDHWASIGCCFKCNCVQPREIKKP